MTPEKIVIICESVLLVVFAVIIAVLKAKLDKKPTGKADNVFVKKGVRYTYDEKETGSDGEVKITHTGDDVILERGVTYVVQKKGKIIPGKYTVLSAKEGTDKFNLRIGDFVREYEHAEDIVLAEGEKVCAVSHNVILR